MPAEHFEIAVVGGGKGGKPLATTMATDCRRGVMVEKGTIGGSCINVAAAGIDLDDRGFVKVNERLETTASGVWALGDVNGGPQFTHASLDDYRIVAVNPSRGRCVVNCRSRCGSRAGIVGSRIHVERADQWL